MSTSFKNFGTLNGALSNTQSTGLAERYQALSSLGGRVISLASDLPTAYGRAYSQNQWMKYDSQGVPDDVTPPEQQSASQSIIDKTIQQVKDIESQVALYQNSNVTVDAGGGRLQSELYSTTSFYLEWDGSKPVIKQSYNPDAIQMDWIASSYTTHTFSSDTHQFLVNGVIVTDGVILNGSWTIRYFDQVWIFGLNKKCSVITTPSFAIVRVDSKLFFMADETTPGQLPDLAFVGGVPNWNVSSAGTISGTKTTYDVTNGVDAILSLMEATASPSITGDVISLISEAAAPSIPQTYTVPTSLDQVYSGISQVIASMKELG